MKRLFVGLVLVLFVFLGSNSNVLADCGTPATLPTGTICYEGNNGEVYIPIKDTNGQTTGLMHATIDTTTGEIINSDGGASVTTYDSLPSGYNNNNAVTINQSAGAFTGQVYGTYGNGSPIISGFYQAPNGKYYAIQTTCRTCKSDGSLRQVRGGNTTMYNCPDETYPDFTLGTQSIADYNCTSGSYTCIGGNRTKVIGYPTYDPYINRTIQLTSACVPRCPTGTTYTKTYWSDCVCAGWCDGDYTGAACGGGCAGGRYWCYHWNGSSYTCQPNSITGHVYFDEGNTCSTNTAWSERHGGQW